MKKNLDMSRFPRVQFRGLHSNIAPERRVRQESNGGKLELIRQMGLATVSIGRTKPKVGVVRWN